jgi:hypothetical protein
MTSVQVLDQHAWGCLLASAALPGIVSFVYANSAVHAIHMQNPRPLARTHLILNNVNTACYFYKLFSQICEM